MRNHKLLNDKPPKETVEPNIEQVQDTKEISTNSNSSNSFSNLSSDSTNNSTATLPIPSQTNQSFDAKKIITDSDQKIEPKVIEPIPEPKTQNNQEKSIDKPDKRPTSGTYNFADKANPENVIESFSNQKKSEIKGKMLNSKFSQNNSALIVMLIVIVCLTSLCGFTTYQIYKYEQQIELAKGQVNINITPESTWSGKGFEVKINNTEFSKFQKESRPLAFEFLDDKTGQVDSLLSEDEIKGEFYKTGIIIYSTPFDSKLGLEEFQNKILQKNGSQYVATTQKIALPNDIVVAKLSSKNSKDGISLLAVVTSNNYYVLKLYNQGQDIPELKTKNQLIEEIITKIKLS